MNEARRWLLAARFFRFLRRAFEPSSCWSVFTTKLMNPFWCHVNAPAVHYVNMHINCRKQKCRPESLRRCT